MPPVPVFGFVAELLDCVPAGLDLVTNFLRRLAANEVNHAGPEAASTDSARHQIRTVKAERGCIEQDFPL